jgi:hypothetical protein
MLFSLMPKYDRFQQISPAFSNSQVILTSPLIGRRLRIWFSVVESGAFRLSRESLDSLCIES